jgi:hypothetical protein
VVLAKDERREKELIQKKDNQEPTVSKERRRKGVGSIKCCLLAQPRRLMFLS